MRAARYLLPIFLLAAALPALASKPSYREYIQVSNAIEKGNTDSSLATSLDSWRGYHGETVGAGGPGTRTKICYYQLKLQFLDNASIKTQQPTALWKDEARALLKAVAKPDEAECNRLVPVEKIVAKAEGALKQFESARLTGLRDECLQLRTKLAQYSGVAGINCQADSLEALETHLRTKIDAARTALVEQWGRYGKSVAFPVVSGMEPAEAVDSLIAGVAANRKQRDDLWAQKMASRSEALGSVPAAARADYGNPPAKPADLTDWGYWAALKDLEDEVETIVATGANYAETRKNLLAELDRFERETESCAALSGLCKAGWAGNACNQGTASRLLSECGAVDLADRERAGPQKIQAAITARRYLAGKLVWDEALGQLRGQLENRARAAEQNCQPKDLPAMQESVSRLATARVTEGPRFVEASSAILRCQQGAAFDYRDLASAMERLMAGDATCASPLEARKQALERTAGEILRRGTAAQNDALLAQGKQDLGAALACVATRLRESHDGARERLEQLQGRYTLAGDWLQAVSDSRYEALRARIRSATPAAADGGFACGWEGSVSIGQAAAAVESYLSRCSPAEGAGSAGDSCALLVVAAVAAAGPDFANARWSAAEKRFEQVGQTCGSEIASLGERHRRLLEYFRAYVNWKQDKNFDRQVSKLNYDPAFDKELSGVTQ